MSWDIRQEARSKMRAFINKLGGFGGAFGAEDHLPCFMHRVNTCRKITTMIQARKFIDLALEANTGYVETVCISVTDEDPEKDVFLKVAERDGHTIVGPCASIHGEYNCWAIFATRKHAVDADRSWG